MLLDDHRLRVARLLRGDRRVTDLDRLFADLRLARPGRISVREVGHFAAHRGERDSGVVLERANHIQTSLGVWYRQMEGWMPDLEDVRTAAEANLAIAPEEVIRDRLRMSRQVARGMLKKGFKELEQGRSPKRKEKAVIEALGFRGMWQFAFDDGRLMADLTDLLLAEGALAAEHREAFLACSVFVTLHALSLMHGADLKLPDGSTAPLRLAIREETGTLRIKAQIPLVVTLKPASADVSLFETSLPAQTHLDPGVVVARGARMPLEIDGHGRLASLA